MARGLVIPVVALLCPCLGGCLTHIPSPPGERPTAHVYFLRGGAGYLPGIEPLSSALGREGAELRLVRNVDWPDARDEILKRKRAGQITGPIILVGYSAGGATAWKIADGLSADGVPVDSLVLIETTRPDLSVPANVHRCLNLYRPDGIFGGKVIAAGYETEIVNYDTSLTQDFRHATHWNITWAEEFPDLIAGEVRKALKRPGATSERRQDLPPVRLLPPRGYAPTAKRHSHSHVVLRPPTR